MPISFSNVVVLLRAFWFIFARSHMSVHFIPVFLFLFGVHYSSSLPYLSILPSPRSMPKFIAIFFMPMRGCLLIAQAARRSCERLPRWLLLRLCICSFVLLFFSFLRSFIAVAALEDRFCETRSVLAFCGIYPFFVKLNAGFAIALRIHLSLRDICFLMA